MLARGVAGLSPRECASTSNMSPTQRLRRSGICRRATTCKNPFAFMELQDVQELTNFFERRVSAYQVGGSGEVGFNEEF